MSHVESELVAYHFGLVENDERKRIEDHLASCRECLQTFLDVKRAVETGAEGPSPSPKARERLRNAVFAELHPTPKRALWERPVAFAIAASVVLFAGAATRVLTSGPGSPPYALSDHDKR
jgi:anti-sigma factor RsiW